MQLNDNQQSWMMQQDGTYQKITRDPSEQPLSAQQQLLDALSNR